MGESGIFFHARRGEGVLKYPFPAWFHTGLYAAYLMCEEFYLRISVHVG